MRILRKTAGAHDREARAVQMHLHMSEEPFRAIIYRLNAAEHDRDADFVRACAVEMHFNIAREPFHAEIYRKNLRAQVEHPDQAQVFTLTVRTPHCGHSVWGKM